MIIQRAGGNPGEVKFKADLDLMLYEIVVNKKVFLVLDDVWDAQVWEDMLYKPLQSCSAGSRVLVTTRHEVVARRMGASHCHQVERLSDEDGWSLLSKMVFLDGRDTIDAQNTLRDIGMRIVIKCAGLPLALKTIAGVLRNKDKSLSDWQKVLENPSWTLAELPEGVMGALYLSYTELPSDLKQCFLYFALFPEDYEFVRERFVCLWIAEGFVEAKGNMLMEELGTEYWNDLVYRNLLQPETEWYGFSICKMHDMLHFLARHLASDEYFCQDMQEVSDKSTCSSWSMNVRRAHIRNGKEAIPNVFLDRGSLRTLLLPCHRNFSKVSVKKLKFLRIVDIRQSSLDMLPNSIGDLVHLKYLNVSETALREVPESIGNLENLQFLIMGRCKNLHCLPKSITNLCNLRRLNLFETRLHNMPIGIGKLKSLIELYGFWLPNHNTNNGNKKGNRGVKPKDQHQSFTRYSNLEELGSLTQLMSLNVYKLESASSREEARAAALTLKPNLSSLELHCTTRSSDAKPDAYCRKEEIEKIGEVFEELIPPLCLETLGIEGYFALKYPSWLMEMPSSYLPNLRRLELVDNILITKLPPFGLLPQLKFLNIVGASAVKSIGPEFFGLGHSKVNAGGEEAAQHCSCFPKLEILQFTNMPNWVDWSWSREEEEMPISILMPQLRHLTLKGCPKLRLLPEGLIHHATALTQLIIEGCHSLTELKNLHHLQVLELTDCSCVERVSNLPSLKELWIKGCGALNHVEGLVALQRLTLHNSGKESLPEWLLGAEESKFPALRVLQIKDDPQHLSKCTVDGPYWDKIRHIPRVNACRYGEQNCCINYTTSPFCFTLPNHEGVANEKEGTISSTTFPGGETSS